MNFRITYLSKLLSKLYAHFTPQPLVWGKKSASDKQEQRFYQSCDVNAINRQQTKLIYRLVEKIERNISTPKIKLNAFVIMTTVFTV